MRERLRSLFQPVSLKPIVLGAAVASLAFLGQTNILSSVSGAFKDRDVLARWSSVLSGATRHAIPVTIIDIDDATLERVGGGDRAPRDLVAQLAGLAAAKNAAGVVLDLDTSRPGPNAAADQALIDFVGDYPANAPMLMYARRFIEANGRKPATELDLTPLPSMLDAVAARIPNVMSVSTVAPLDSDRVIRRWQLSQTICQTGGKDMSVPSPQLVALALKERGASARQSIDQYLDWRSADVCGASAPSPSWPRNPDITAAIWFVFGSTPADAPITMVESGGQRTPLVRHIPARTLIGQDGRVAPARVISDQIFAGRIVVIGSSHLDSFDTHMTPLGPMPGALIVANAIASAPATLSAPEIPSIVRTLIAMGIFVALAILTRPLRGMVAGMAVVFSMLVVLALLGRVLAPSSALTIVVTATALLALFSGLSSIYETAEACRRFGWRAILKNPPPQAENARTEAQAARRRESGH